MIKPAFVLTLLLVNGMAHAADDFDARVARATKVERSSPVGREYLIQQFMPEVHAALEDLVGTCSAGGNRPSTTETFTVVFDVDAEGRITNVAVSEQDQSEYALCYAKGMAQIKGPPPPASFAEKGFPIVIHESHEFR